MAAALARGHRIEIRGFGSFSINRRPPRVGRNPRSGEQVVISEKLVPHFKPGKALREAVDQRVGACASRPPRPPSAADARQDRALESRGSRCDTLVWLRPRRRLLHAVRVRAEQPARRRRVHWFFGYEWRAPMVFIVLAAFGARLRVRHLRDGAELVAASAHGAHAHAPRRRPRRRRGASRRRPRSPPHHPPRDGL